ncbi:MAG: hypothetical protein EOP36_02080 [Rubrivivax sp.]|nr:MAG: hypothetical protein EOP36_02080 [Rubrivivax sp.]
MQLTAHMDVPSHWLRSTLAALLAFGIIAHPSVQAANTDISNTPLASTSDITAKPNVMFVLDGSGSMAWSFMPDDLGQSGNDKTDTIAFGRWGTRSAQCNGLAYNPNFKYEENLPVKPDGKPYPHAVFTAAPSDGFQATGINTNGLTAPISIGTGDLNFTITSSSPNANNITERKQVIIYNSADDTQWMIGTVKLWNKPVVTVTITDAVGGGDPAATTWRIGTRSAADLTDSYYYTYSGNKKALGWKYTKDGLDRTDGFADECLRSTGSASSVFTKVLMETASAEQQQRYADWYAYYRKRYLMMRTVAGQSFKTIDEKFRVGFTTIADTTAAPSNTFLDVEAFDATQKAKFYRSLYKADPDGSTPLRGALSKVGRYFANRAPGQANDPMQYACQRNYTILSTDGYWNSGMETSSYGPLKLNGSTTVGQQDALEARPMYDGAKITRRVKKTWTTTSVKVDTTVTQKPVISTSSVTTKTFTPVRGVSRNSYSLAAIQKSLGVSLGRCSLLSFGSCNVTVTTSSAHGFITGSSVTIAGASPAVYNGSFTIIAPVGSNSFTYKITGQLTRPNTPTGATITASSSCNALVTQPQRGDEYAVTTSTVTDTTTTPITKTDVKTTTIVTPWTNTIVYVNDTVDTKTGDVAGAATTTSPTVSTTTTGAPFTTQTTNNGTLGSVTDWSNNGAATTGSTCGVSLPSPNPSSPTTVGLSTSAAVYFGTDPVVNTGPTNTTGTPTTTTVGPNVVSTPEVIEETTTISEGSSNSLADVAEYYYVTDLRTAAQDNCVGALGVDVCHNEVPPSGRDTASNQHMTTFTLGLGVNGILDYRTNYLSASQNEGSYYKILNKLDGVSWPNPSAVEDATHVDDLWHAAVNGRGQYWATSDPGSLSNAISTALSSVKETTGASSSAATSSLKPVAGEDNLVFVATFKTVEWSGDLVAYNLDAKLGVIDLKNPVWSAKDQLAALAPANRNIYYSQPGSVTPTRRNFTHANLTDDGLADSLNNLCAQASVAAQCSTLPDDLKTIANSGSNLVNYLRGDGRLTSYTYVPDISNPDAKATAALYRPRATALGDIINASPVYLSKPPFHYADTGYAAFVTSQATRQPVVFAAANDGMLHAFAAKTNANGSIQAGSELWAYVPRVVIPNLYRLADVDYKDKHRYFVDGTPTIGDIRVNGTWKTILVGGLNAGGKGYYALDVTDPIDPKPLWEFTDANLGLTYGNPIITKRADGTWVVVFSSGYNNSTGDGNGRLYVLDANTGVAPTGTPTVTSIPTMVSETTPAGTSTLPSGLGKINAWIEDSADNTAKRFYGGDLLGNLWRFDIDDLVAPKGKAFLLATFKTSSTTPQPIMTRPETAEITYNGTAYPIIMVGTGRYLGLTDIPDHSVQTIYAVKDALTTTGLGDVYQREDIVHQTLTTLPDDGKGTIPTRSSSANAVDWSRASGWLVDLPSPGERVAIDMQLQYNTLAVISAIPGTNVCKPAGGSSWLYTFDIAKGVAPTTAAGITGTYLGDFLGVGLTWIELGDGTSRLIIPGSDASMHVTTPPSASGSGGSTAHRTSWRELVN